MELLQDFKHGRVGIYSTLPIHNKTQFRLLFNILLSTQFGLEPYMKAEGGVINNNVHLINDRGLALGLKVNTEISNHPSNEEKEVLRWYADILKILFIEGTTGDIQRNLLWQNEQYSEDSKLRFMAFYNAVVRSKWHFDRDKTTSQKSRWFIDIFMSQYKAIMTYHLYPDEFLPITERADFAHIRMETNLV